eukprot:EC820071.1.p1 GENE.EC820071.1~~EC820071.1.p1  ORF type:complete len:116 (+),score=28.18 EC820071.1:40-387(+)
MNTLSSIKVKIYISDKKEKQEIRKFNVNENFDDFLNILNLPNYDNVKFLYLDNELEWVTFNSQIEYKEMFNQFKKINGDCLRIKILKKEKKKKRINNNLSLWKWNLIESDNKVFN